MESEQNFDELNQAILKDVKARTFENCAYGCVLGAFIGDSCGSFMEFINCP